MPYAAIVIKGISFHFTFLNKAILKENEYENMNNFHKYIFKTHWFNC